MTNSDDEIAANGAADEALRDLFAQFKSNDNQTNRGRFHDTNARNDFVAIVTAYLGRAADRVPRNDVEGCDYRENLVKAGAVILGAIVAYDEGMPSRKGEFDDGSDV